MVSVGNKISMCKTNKYINNNNQFTTILTINYNLELLLLNKHSTNCNIPVDT